MTSSNCGYPNTSYPEPVSTVNLTQTILQFGEVYGVWQQVTLAVGPGGGATLPSSAVNAAAVNLYVNGVLQQQGEDYVAAPNSVTFLNPAEVPPTAIVTASYLSVAQGGDGDVPVGTIVGFAAAAVPISSQFLVCDGAAYNAQASTEYAALYAVIENTYGGTDITNFQVPELQLPFYQGNQLIYGPAYIRF